MDNNLEQVMNAICDDVLQLSKSLLSRDDIATNRKAGKNTLKSSALENSAQVEVLNQGQSVVVRVLFDNYIEYIENGRKPRSGKQPPLDALRDWALERGIPTDNSTLFLISRAIWRDGYEGRPILATLEEEIERLFEDKWAEEVLRVLMKNE
ncbi:MAG: hypothetical protein E6767_12095 [Dysgonomonas sp.]|nr:hypothetical protein [Dysgonomonas sp.]